MGTPVVLMGMEATRYLREVAYEHVCTCMCEIMLCDVFEIVCKCAHVTTRYMSDIMGVCVQEEKPQPTSMFD